MATEEQADELHARFAETDEFVEWEDFKNMTQEALERDPAAETVTVPAAFLRRVIAEISTQPLIFSALLDRHNRLCDELGLPEEKCALGGYRLRARPECMALERDVAIPKSFPLKFMKRRKRKNALKTGKEGKAGK